MHALRPEEVQAILTLADEAGEVDGSHRKLAHRSSYLGRVWVSPSTVLRVLLEHGRRLPYRAEAAICWADAGCLFGRGRDPQRGGLVWIDVGASSDFCNRTQAVRSRSSGLANELD